MFIAQKPALPVGGPLEHSKPRILPRSDQIRRHTRTLRLMIFPPAQNFRALFDDIAKKIGLRTQALSNYDRHRRRGPAV